MAKVRLFAIQVFSVEGRRSELGGLGREGGHFACHCVAVLNKASKH